MVSAFKKTDNGTVSLRIESDFNFPMLVPISIRSVEEAAFINGTMMSSSVNRRVNGKEKLNQKLVSRGNSYEWARNDSHEIPTFPIRFSVVSLYFEEPKNQLTIFSDALGTTVPIKQIRKGTYRLDLPNGNFNYYNYVNGICTMIEIHHSFFEIQFVLKSDKTPTE